MLLPTASPASLPVSRIAIFSFTGIELLGTMDRRNRDPQKILPKAINAAAADYHFYLLSMVVIIAVASGWRLAGCQPFVTLFANAGLPAAAAAVINFVALTSAMSSTSNSGVYSSTRMLYGLSVEKHAHGQFRILSRTTRIPVRSLLCSPASACSAARCCCSRYRT